MNIVSVARGERGFTVTFDDQSDIEYPFIWLRDNDPDNFHPDTRERVFDLTTIELDIEPSDYGSTAGTLSVHWPDKTSASAYAADWLLRHRPGVRRGDPSVVAQSLWDAAAMAEVPRVDSRACSSDPAALLSALQTLKRFGIVLFHDLDDSLDGARQFAEAVGFPRQTNFGVMFEVISMPDPNNLAYTSLALPLHTDLPNQELIPGYQFLHAYRNSATGGESVFADGFRVCSDFAKEFPEEFELLCRVPVPFRFHDDNNDIRQHRPVILQRPDGTFDYLVFNAHIADLPDMDSELLYDFYRAYKALMHRIRDPQYAIRYRLRPGEMVAFDNSRVLHGRDAFDPDSGERHYRGYYLERNEVDSRIRVLSRN
ncbi:MAG: TauD/TfdA family dioxygenase [Pseudomonadota bacterium]